MTDTTTGKEYKVITSQLALILVERFKTARSRRLTPPFEVCVTGTDNNLVMHCSVGQDGACHDSASGEELDLRYRLGPEPTGRA